MEAVLHLSGPEETRRLGRCLGRRLEAGAVLALTGNLGAGKTCLTQGLAVGLDVPETVVVASPSFTLANEYRGRVPLYHLDLYRLVGDEFFESGLDEYFGGDGVTVIEWAEKIFDDLPRPRLEIELSAIETGGRRALLRSVGPAFDLLVREVGAAWPEGA
ncbi:MAG: tRNA (adenosine(37)-N6)-threonylcarbamoyltransferase complex ATPase subunit type 1 TsaE [Proteobacteria bacterium]|nr:tRNA (adenosine(37)-N6)-threonylcarbamoyltransferase complex ATPase subunit type 1 TsaE [Pseudomonadota bacterium]